MKSIIQERGKISLFASIIALSSGVSILLNFVRFSSVFDWWYYAMVVIAIICSLITLINLFIPSKQNGTALKKFRRVAIILIIIILALAAIPTFNILVLKNYSASPYAGFGTLVVCGIAIISCVIIAIAYSISQSIEMFKKNIYGTRSWLNSLLVGIITGAACIIISTMIWTSYYKSPDINIAPSNTASWLEHETIFENVKVMLPSDICLEDVFRPNQGGQRALKCEAISYMKENDTDSYPYGSYSDYVFASFKLEDANDNFNWQLLQTTFVEEKKYNVSNLDNYVSWYIPCKEKYLTMTRYQSSESLKNDHDAAAIAISTICE